MMGVRWYNGEVLFVLTFVFWSFFCFICRKYFARFILQANQPPGTVGRQISESTTSFPLHLHVLPRASEHATHTHTHTHSTAIVRLKKGERCGNFLFAPKRIQRPSSVSVGKRDPRVRV